MKDHYILDYLLNMLTHGISILVFKYQFFATFVWTVFLFFITTIFLPKIRSVFCCSVHYGIINIIYRICVLPDCVIENLWKTLYSTTLRKMSIFRRKNVLKLNTSSLPNLRRFNCCNSFFQLTHTCKCQFLQYLTVIDSSF